MKEKDELYLRAWRRCGSWAAAGRRRRATAGRWRQSRRFPSSTTADNQRSIFMNLRLNWLIKLAHIYDPVLPHQLWPSLNRYFLKGFPFLFDQNVFKCGPRFNYFKYTVDRFLDWAHLVHSYQNPKNRQNVIKFRYGQSLRHQFWKELGQSPTLISQNRIKQLSLIKL